MALREWYRIEAKAGSDVANIYVYDAIGKSFWNDETVTAAKFVADLGKLADSVKTIRVHVNSPGGNPWEAATIANALRAQRTERGRTVETRIEGLAASAATIITSAGGPVRIADNAMMMVHNPAGAVLGPATAMRKMADALDVVRDTMITAYRWTSSLSAEELGALMDATTWMDARAAVANGFATEIIAGEKVEACWRPESVQALGTIPDAYRPALEALVRKPESPPSDPSAAAASPAEVLRECKAAGCLDLAEELIEAKATPEQVTARVTSAKREREAAAARAREIRALCADAKLPELADGYIRGQMATDDIKVHLTTLTAKLDRVEIDTGLAPAVEPSVAAGWTKAIAKVQGASSTRKGAAR
jgi:ATP-dependent protease ClpP protease subunit